MKAWLACELGLIAEARHWLSCVEEHDPLAAVVAARLDLIEQS